jgi:hypothetical protein
LVLWQLRGKLDRSSALIQVVEKFHGMGGFFLPLILIQLANPGRFWPSSQADMKDKGSRPNSALNLLVDDFFNFFVDHGFMF